MKKYLENLGQVISELNWRSGKGEIDIIYCEGKEMVFVEVKTRSTSTFGFPESSVSLSKQRMIIKTAREYIGFKNWKGEVRFDIASVILDPKGIKYFKDAFWV